MYFETGPLGLYFEFVEYYAKGSFPHNYLTLDHNCPFFMICSLSMSHGASLIMKLDNKIAADPKFKNIESLSYIK